MAQGSGDHERVKLPDLQTLLGTLRATIFPILKRGEGTHGALAELRDAPDDWTPTGEAKIRLAALSIVEEAIEGHAALMDAKAHYVARAGEDATLVQEKRDKVAAGQKNWEKVTDALAKVREVLEAVREVAEDVEAEGPAGVRLDPRLAGGGKVRTGRIGPPPTIVSWCVRLLLCEYYDWDGRPPFPGENSRELRDRLHADLMGDPSSLAPFDEEEVDPRSEGPLSSIINNLQRMQ